MSNKGSSPPKLFLDFFRWFCHPALQKYIEGDLTELYEERLIEQGKKRADLKFIADVLLLFRPGIIRPSNPQQNLNHYTMYKSYFTIGWRNLLRNKGYSFINIGGLAVGMAITILIGLWIWDEVSFDKNHENYDRIVSVMQQQTVDGHIGTGTAIPRPLETAMRSTFGSDFTYLAMSTWTNEHILSAGEQKIVQQGNYVQADFPEMFSLRMITGSRKGLSDPRSILLSASAAKALFGTGDALNQLVRIDNQVDVNVTGVYEDLPYNSTIKNIGFVSSWDLWLETQPWAKNAAEQWDNNSFQLFAQLAPNADENAVGQKIRSIRAERSKDNYFKPAIILHPMRDWHLRSNWDNGIKTNGRINLVIMVGIIGAIVLLLACINFMNLTTARSEKRSKEVGIRMTIGSVRSQLIKQFLSESFLVVVLAYCLAICAVTVMLPWFNDLADKKIDIAWGNPYFWLACVTFIFITSLLAGSYPAFFLSSFRPVSVLKSTFKTGRLASTPRKVLVVVKFTVSIMLVIGTVVIYQQMQFIKNRPLGYDQNGLIMIEVKSRDLEGKYEALRNELKNTGSAVEVSVSSSPLTEVWNNTNGFSWQGKDPNLQQADFGVISVSREYGKTVGWQIIKGRDFSREFSSDSTAVVLNEAAISYIGTKDPIGFEITDGNEKLHVIGVVKDMIVESPAKKERHYIYVLDNLFQRVNWINIRLNPALSVHESLASVGGVVKKFAPEIPFEYKFVDQEYARKFDLAERISKLIQVFAILATFISCLGLVGLASFVAEQHRKEIGIRKILGASIPQVWKMLSGNFLFLVMISSAIAIPVAYYVMHQWLMSFQFQVHISWVSIVLIELGAILITLMTVSYQALSAAMANPVKSLRSE